MNKEGKSSHLLIQCSFYALVIVVIVTLLYCFKVLFIPLILSVLLTLLIGPFVNFLETKGFKRIHVIISIYIVIVIVAVMFVVFLVPKLINEAQSFAQDLPQYKLTIKNSIIDFNQKLQKKFPEVDIPDFLVIIRNRLPGNKGLDVDAIIEYMSSFFAILSFLVIVPIVTFFLLVDGHLIEKAVLRTVPNRYFEMTILLLHKIITSLKLFLRGQMIDAAAVGIMTAIGLAIIGLPYFLVIGIIAGIGNLIPYLGPIIGLIPAILVVILQPEGITFWSILAILGVFAAVQVIEGTFIYPIAVGKSVNLHPLVVIIGVTVGGEFGGVLGMLLAIPLISIVKVSFEVLYSYLKSYSII